MIIVNNSDVEAHLELSWAEVLMASTYCCGVCSPLKVPYSAVRKIRIVANPWRELRGCRVGTGIPGVIMLGSRHFWSGKDFWAVYGRGPAVVMDIDRDFSPYDRWIFTCEPHDLSIVELQSKVIASQSPANGSLMHNVDNLTEGEEDFHE